MRINAGFLIFAVFACQMAFAQLQTGRNFFYYERYHSAKEAFAKDAETNPEATYWLGQTMIELKDIEGAKALYQKSLTSNGNSPLILVGMGHIELLENKTSDARQRFEAAISLTKSRDIKVLNAIGRANVESRAGDNLYAIEKLNLATSIKGFKDPEVYINLGNAYRKMGDGGNAIVSYSKALSTDPKYAAARHFTGKVYLSQNNREFFIPEFEGAIAIDPAYAPSYRELYHYYYFRDVNKAIEYLEKYAANTDQTPELEYEKTSVLYAARKYQEAISQAEKIMAAKGDNYSPKYHRLLAFSYNALGDSINALKNIEIFLSRATEDILLPTDFDLLGTLQFKFPGRESQAIENIEKAIEMDTTVTKKIEYAEKVAGILDARGMLRQAADWKIKAYNFLPNPGKTDLFYAGFAYIKAQEYPIADSMFAIYAEKFPNDIYGHYWRARANSYIDSTSELGLAVPHFQRFIELAEKDTAENRRTLIQAYGYLAAYSANVLKDSEAAVAYFDKILVLDPGNADAQRYKEILQKQLPQKNSGSNSGSKPSAGQYPGPYAGIPAPDLP